MDPDDQIALFGALPIPADATRPPPFKRVRVHFETIDDMRAFGALIDQPINFTTRVVRFDE
jgi:hypothetical protein